MSTRSKSKMSNKSTPTFQFGFGNTSSLDVTRPFGESNNQSSTFGTSSSFGSAFGTSSSSSSSFGSAFNNTFGITSDTLVICHRFTDSNKVCESVTFDGQIVNESLSSILTKYKNSHKISSVTQSSTPVSGINILGELGTVNSTVVTIIMISKF